jgi:hypothetical protein
MMRNLWEVFLNVAGISGGNGDRCGEEFVFPVEK